MQPSGMPSAVAVAVDFQPLLYFFQFHTIIQFVFNLFYENLRHI